MKLNTIITILLVLFSTSLLFISTPEGSSGTKYIRNGKEYGVTRGLFRGKWWNYFERGQSFAEGEFWNEAESDLKKAIKKRSKDKRRARTYGLHFVEYFAHRELGIVYHNQGKHEKSESELILSLSQEESARAKFYLNKARKSIIEQAKSDRSPPNISISTPVKGTVISSLDVMVKGTATDDKYISEVAINGKPVFIETADKKINFSKNIKLKPGDNTVLITATDLAGKVTYQKIPVTVDRQAPLLSIESIRQQSKDSYFINGMVTDKTGLAELNINGESVQLTDIYESQFSHTVYGTEGLEIAFRVADLSGNTTNGTIVLETLSINQPENIKAASNWYTKPIRYALPTGYTANDSVIHERPKHTYTKRISTADNIPPFIKLNKGIENKQTVFVNSFFIEGKVKDAGGVVSLTINDEPIVMRTGVKLHFNYLPELEVGSNELVIIATDAAGNSSKKIIHVERKVPASHQISSRLATAILPFQKKGDEDTLTSIVPDSFLDALSSQNRFNIVARSNDLEAVLAELKLSASDLADKSKALKLGRIVSAEIVIGGTVMETSKFLQLYARVIDTETTEIIVSTDVYGEDKDMEAFEYLIGGLAWKIMRSFPMIEGTIVKFDDKNVYLDKGQDESVKKNMRFIIYRPVKLDTSPETPAGIVEMLREVKISSVDSNISKSKIVRQLNDKPIRVNDLAISK